MRIKKLLLFLILCSVLVDSVLAVELSLLKPNYLEGEVVQAKVVLDVKLLKGMDSAFGLYKNGDKVFVPLKSVNFNEHYIIYFPLDSIREGSYTFGMKDVEYFKDGVLSKGSFLVELSVVKGEDGLRVFPGAVELKVRDYERPKLRFNVKNLGGKSVNFNASMKFLEGGGELSLIGLGSKDIIFNLNPSNFWERYTIDELVVGDYHVPVIVERLDYKEAKIAEEIVEVEKEEIIEEEIKFGAFSEEELNIELNEGQSEEGPIIFKNNGKKELNLKDVSISEPLKDFVSVGEFEDSVLLPGEVGSLILYINKDKNLGEDVSGSLRINTREGASVEYKISLKLIKSEPLEVVEEGNETRGKIETKEEKKSYFAIILFVVLFVILILGLLYFYLASRKKVTMEEIISRKK